MAARLLLLLVELRRARCAQQLVAAGPAPAGAGLPSTVPPPASSAPVAR